MRLNDHQQLRTLASGVRQELVDTLAALGGEASVRELATQLGRPMDGLYYHLRRLQSAGLVRLAAPMPDDRADPSAATTSSSSERRYRLAESPEQRPSIDYASADPADLLAVVQSLLRVAESDFRDAQGNPDTATSGPTRELWAGRNKGWLDPAGLREVNQLLARLAELLRQGPRRDGDKLYALSFVLAPQSVREPRR